MTCRTDPSLAFLPETDSGVEMVAKFFRALGDPGRLRLLEFLVTSEHTVTECVTHVGLSQGRVSSHLACPFRQLLGIFISVEHDQPSCAAFARQPAPEYFDPIFGALFFRSRLAA